VHNPNVLVSWQVYLDLYCIFENGTVDKAQMINFWLKFFDQRSEGKCLK